MSADFRVLQFVISLPIQFFCLRAMEFSLTGSSFDQGRFSVPSSVHVLHVSTLLCRTPIVSTVAKRVNYSTSGRIVRGTDFYQIIFSFHY
uniref:Secreted protein n=1 Tax=Angiostrongylus cantonensis TaxID=6313 RepID=A0A0K0CTB9_ANGCA